MRIFYRVLNSTIAGGQRVALQVMEEAARRGHEPILSTTGPGRLTEIAREKKIPVHFSPFGKTFHFHEACRLASFLRREKVDLIHSHDAVAGNILTRLAGKMAGIPVISHIHIQNAFSANRGVRVYQEYLDNLTSRICRKIVAVSHQTKAALERQGNPKHLLEVVHNGIDAPAPSGGKPRAAILDDLRLPAAARLVGCVGRLCPTKGQEDLLSAAAELFPLHPDLFLIFVGEDMEKNGEYRHTLERLAQSLSIARRVRFAGYQPDVNAFMRAFEMLVLPSHMEGLPLVVLEAMACAKPVIATDAGGTPEIVMDGETGRLVPPGEIKKLADALNALLTNPPLGVSMGESGLTRVKRHFSTAGMMRRIFDLYQEATRGIAVMNPLRQAS